jgi:lauroyl/myristoyl acyltransferase
MIFLNFSQFPENTFLETKLNFSLTGKCFSLTNFSNNKQTQKNLKNYFSKIIFQEKQSLILKNFLQIEKT